MLCENTIGFGRGALSFRSDGIVLARDDPTLAPQPPKPTPKPKRYGSDWSSAGNPVTLAPYLYRSEFRSLHAGPGPDLAGPGWLGATQANVRLAWESSPASRLYNITSPLLLIQGDADESVAFQETLAVARSLRRRGFPRDKLGWFVVPGECHGQCAFVNQLEAANRTAEWLLRWL